MDKKISLNTKLEIAVEVLAAKIGNMSSNGYTIEDKEIKDLLDERDKLYSFDEATLDKIISEYGPELKKRYEGV